MIITNYKPHTDGDEERMNDLRRMLLRIIDERTITPRARGNIMRWAEAVQCDMMGELLDLTNGVLTAAWECQRENADAVWTTWLKQARAEVEAIA